MTEKIFDLIIISFILSTLSVMSFILFPLFEFTENLRLLTSNTQNKIVKYK